MLNCIIIDDDKPSIRILENYAGKMEDLKIAGSFDNPTDALLFLQKKNQKVDLIFLDVEMPEINGFELLNSLDAKPEVILVTGTKDHAVEAFEYEVADFLVKPYSFSRFFQSVQKVKGRTQNASGGQEANPPTSCVFVKESASLKRIDLNTILWIEALGDYIKIITPEGMVTAHTTMKKIEEAVKHSRIKRIHRSYFVNLDHIDNMDYNMVAIGEKFIPIGNKYRKVLGDSIQLI